MKKRECPSCAMQVPESSSNCPVCDYEFPRYNPLKRWVFVAVALVLLVLFLMRVL